MKLHLGCGHDSRNGYINLDASSEVKPDVVWNLEVTPLPFENDSFEEVLANHVLEHVVNFIPLVHEIHRVSIAGANVLIRVPFYAAWGQFNDPTHVRFFTPYTFNYFNMGRYSHEVGSQNNMFEIIKVELNFGVGTSRKLNWLFNPILNLNHKVYCRFFAWIFPCSEIYFELKVLK